MRILVKFWGNIMKFNVNKRRRLLEKLQRTMSGDGFNAVDMGVMAGYEDDAQQFGGYHNVKIELTKSLNLGNNHTTKHFFAELAAKYPENSDLYDYLVSIHSNDTLDITYVGKYGKYTDEAALDEFLDALESEYKNKSLDGGFGVGQNEGRILMRSRIVSESNSGWNEDTPLEDIVHGLRGMSAKEISNKLQSISDDIGAYGVETITNPNEWDSYFGDIVVEYINMGDTYTPTIVLDTVNGNVYAMSWGDFLEKHGEDVGLDSSGEPLQSDEDDFDPMNREDEGIREVTREHLMAAKSMRGILTENWKRLQSVGHRDIVVKVNEADKSKSGFNPRSGRNWDAYSAVGVAEGFEEADSTDEQIEAWAYIAANGLYRQLQGFFGRQIKSMVDYGYLTWDGHINWEAVDGGVEE